MDHFLARLVRRGLVGALPLYAACTCEPQLVVLSPASIANTTIAPQPSKEECKQLCGPHVTKCERVPVLENATEGWQIDSKDYTIACTMQRRCPGGRRPAGLDDTVIAAAGVGAHFAELARLEAASVHAFIELAAELELHGAPRVLVDRARRAAVEEITHARITARLARTFAGAPVAPSVAATPPRALTEVLLENAVEGLVQERYGAALAAVRATRARTPAVRDAMRAIALDEARHAELAAAVHAWGLSRVPHAALPRIREARERAVHELRGALEVEPSPELAATGMPSATLAIDVLDAVAMSGVAAISGPATRPPSALGVTELALMTNAEDANMCGPRDVTVGGKEPGLAERDDEFAKLLADRFDVRTCATGVIGVESRGSGRDPRMPVA